MFRWGHIGIFLFGLVAAGPAGLGQTLVVREETPGGYSLAARSRWIRYEIVWGRVTATCEQFSANVNDTWTHPANEAREILSVDVTSGVPSIHFEARSKTEELHISLVEHDRLVIRRTPREGAAVPTLVYEQLGDGEVTLVVGTDAQARSAKAAGLWHLMLIEPDLTRQHLTPLLEHFRPSWKLNRTATNVEESLWHWAARDRQAEQERWRQAVALLASPEFRQREAAQRELCDAGPGVLAFLRRTDQSRLEAEQKTRIQAVIAATSADHDTLEQIVPMVADDPRVWLSLIDRCEESCRRAGVEQLSRLMGRPLEFDPAADPETRRRQVARLTEQLPADATARREPAK